MVKIRWQAYIHWLSAITSKMAVVLAVVAFYFGDVIFSFAIASLALGYLPFGATSPPYLFNFTFPAGKYLVSWRLPLRAINSAELWFAT